MKKLLGCFLCVMLLVFGTSVSLLAVPFDTTLFSGDKHTYGPDAPSLGDTQVTNWLTGLVGDPGVVLYSVVNDFSPGPGWDYAVLHTGGGPGTINLFVYEDTVIPIGGDDILQPEHSYRYGVSFIRYYGERSVPEPATMFLLGTGLIGLALFGRQRFKK